MFAKDINDASCLAVNHKHQLIVFGCERYVLHAIFIVSNKVVCLLVLSFELNS